jgi:hypothetical protein
MHAMETETGQGEQLAAFVRNRYFYGKLLDVYHFELEQQYMNSKRWLINRLVSGYGVVCGLDVECSGDGKGVIVGPGIAIDKAGYEIVVPRKTDPIPLLARTKPTHELGQHECPDEEWVHVSLCYRQCEADPVRVLSDECGDATTCSASSIVERYKVTMQYGKAPSPDLESTSPDLIVNGRVNYYALVERVTRHCPKIPVDTCIPLANVRLPQEGQPCEEIDINVRPIVYTNDLLFEMLLAAIGETQLRSRGGKH